MDIFDSRQRKLLSEVLSLSLSNLVPFIAYIMPQSEEIVFFSSPDNVPPKSNRKVLLSSWLGEKDVYLYECFDLHQTLNFLKEKSRLQTSDNQIVKYWPNSTDREKYIEDVANLINSLKETGGKCVISTVFSINRQIDFKDYTQVWLKLCEKHHDDFRFIFYSLSTGAWMGASPEKLLSIDLQSRRFSTMALAGTRKINNSMPWDVKNIEEHEIVVKFITQILCENGCTVKCGEHTTKTYGNMQHLMTPIEGVLGLSAKPFDVINMLSPTPALSGYPRSQSLRQIDDIELHPRNFYGGYIAIEDSDSIEAFVNLRSMHFDSDGCCLYAGGGITPRSDAANEWDETRLKLSELRELVEKFCK